MKLLDEIIAVATDSKEPISVVLRKCLVLAFQLKNDPLKDWIEQELNGYPGDGHIPEYRQVTAHAKGTFHGAFGGSITDQPLPAGVLDNDHRHWARSLKLLQPIAAYETLIGGHPGNQMKAVVEWPAGLTAHYQTRFIEGWVLNRAWQEIPESCLIALVDTVRNRVLRLALELGQESALLGEDATALPAEKVDQVVNNYIFGSNVVISKSAHGITQVGSVSVGQGDMTALKEALKSIGADHEDLERLDQALQKDAEDTGGKGLGKRVVGWLSSTATSLGHGSMTVAADVAKSAATGWIMSFLGLK